VYTIVIFGRWIRPLLREPVSGPSESLEGLLALRGGHPDAAASRLKTDAGRRAGALAEAVKYFLPLVSDFFRFF
jgi:hypothetical protein